MRRATTLAVVAVLGMFGTVPLVRAEVPQDCLNQCAVDLTTCKGGCIDGGGFDGCEDECRWVYEGCADAC